MNREQLFREIGEIDERYIEEAYVEAKIKKPSFTWMKWGSMVACFCILVTVVIAGGKYFHYQESWGSDSAVTTESTVEESAPEEIMTEESVTEENAPEEIMTEESVMVEEGENTIVYRETQTIEYEYEKSYSMIAENGVEVRVDLLNSNAISGELMEEPVIVEGILVEGIYYKESEGDFVYLAQLDLDGIIYSVSTVGTDITAMEEANYQVVSDIISGEITVDDMEQVD